MSEKKETAKAKTFDGGVTEEQISRWKAVHKKVFRIDIADGDELHIVYLKRPTIETISAVSKLSKTDEVKSFTVLFDNCYLGGDTEVREDALLLMAAGEQMGRLMSSCTGSLKNL